MKRRFYLGKCWKQKLLPIRVLLLHLVPVLVVAKQRLAELTPTVFFGGEIIPKVRLKGGRQILQGNNPLRRAFSKSREDETFLTILHDER